MAASWRRALAWMRSKRIPSSTEHGGGTLEPTEKIPSSAAPGERTHGGTTTTTHSNGTTTGGTTCTTTSSGSGRVRVREGSFDFLPSFSVLQPPAVSEVEQIANDLGEEEMAKKLENIKDLVVRFPSDEAAPERWLLELEIIWVLHPFASVGEGPRRSFISGQLLYLARSWILALFKITESISAYFGGISKEDGPPAASDFVRFVEATLSKMLPFVDAIVAVRTCPPNNYKRHEAGEEPADEKLEALILLHDAISMASAQILSSCTQDLLLAEQLRAKLDEGAWNTIQETKAGFLGSYWWGTPRSCAIHPLIRSFITYMKVLWVNYGSVNRILHDAFHRGEFVACNENVSYLTNLTLDMVYSLEEKLTRGSQSFTDQRLKFLCLINNYNYLLQHLHNNLAFGLLLIPEISGRIDDYINSYIQLSWAPVLKYLLCDPTPHCYFTRRSPQSMFESEFQKVYSAQKLWKVPDPHMRKRMRQAIIQEVIPGYTEFFKDKTINTISTPRTSPQVMEKMLEELFEG